MPRPLSAGHRVRGLAHEVLVRVETEEAFADVLLAHRLEATRLSAADRALVTRLVYDTLAWQGRLDHHLAQLVKRPLPSLDPTVRVALRLGLCQLTVLERVPAHAAVDTSVRLARRGGGPGAAGLVNAVLRRAAREGVARLTWPDDPVARLAVELSHPRWLVELWICELGVDEARALLAADNQRGRTTLRANLARSTVDELVRELAEKRVQATPGRFAPAALDVAQGGGTLRSLPAFEQGRFAFQGEASQLVTALVAPAAGGRVLDACAAPGGKSCALAAAASVVALDPHVIGVRRIVAEAARLDVARLHATVGDARHPPFAGTFDAVLVDAPCSGLGTLRRHPELRWRRQPADVERLAELQSRLLTALAPHVRPGGALVYAVCTLTERETTGVVSAFLASQPRFHAVDARSVLPEAAAALVTSEGTLRTLPHRHDLDGFFAVRLERDAG
jgi:16S rRNA (cytosine967-C5)-methyltransferase